MWLLFVLLSILSLPRELMLEGQIATWPVLPEELMGVKTQFVVLLFSSLLIQTSAGVGLDSCLL